MWVYGLFLGGIGVMFLWPDLRSVVRRFRWERAQGVVVTRRTAIGDIANVDYVLPNGEAVSVPVNRAPAGSPANAPMPVVVLYDPRAPRTDIEIRRPLWYRLPWGLIFIALGIREGWG